MITHLPLKQQLFAETGVYHFLFLDFFYWKKLPSWKLCVLPSWHVGQSAECRCFCFSSGRPTKVIGFQLFLTPNDKSLCFGSFVSWQRQWYDEGWDPEPQVDGWEGTKMVGPHALHHAISFVFYHVMLGGASKGSPGMMYVFSQTNEELFRTPESSKSQGFGRTKQ